MPPQEGGALIRESLGLHLAETADRADAPGVRFVLAGGSTLRSDAQLNARLKNGELKVVGTYVLAQRTGIRRVTQSQAALALLRVEGVAAPAPPERPAPDRGAQARVFVSVLASLGIAGWALVGGVRRAR